MVCDALIFHIQPVKAPWPFFILIVNLLLPGVGTMINSLLGMKFNATTFFVGILQLLSSYVIVGWLWALWWSVLIINKSGASEYHLYDRFEKK